MIEESEDILNGISISGNNYFITLRKIFNKEVETKKMHLILETSKYLGASKKQIGDST